jgi:hypothetical protein
MKEKVIIKLFRSFSSGIRAAERFLFPEAK